jgi:hypothetical protein
MKKHERQRSMRPTHNPSSLTMRAKTSTLYLPNRRSETANNRHRLWKLLSQKEKL